MTRVESEASFGPALDEAFRFDGKVLVEQAVAGREIEVAVLGNERPEASVPGEIVSTSSFYDYDAKYTSPDASRMEVPADLPPDVAERVRQLAVEAYRVLGCEGLARVDFFVQDDGTALLNEVNTLPGFTERSMYPGDVGALGAGAARAHGPAHRARRGALRAGLGDRDDAGVEGRPSLNPVRTRL